MDACRCLRSHARNNSEKTALFCDDEVMSYGALDRSSTELAQWFLRQGLSRGDRVALHWSNSIEAVQLIFGIFKAGLIAVTVNTRLKPSEIGYILDHSGSRMCFSEPALSTGSEQAGAACPVFTKLPPFESVESSEALPALEADQPAVILYTSGTTAHPKGVIHTHRSIYQTSVIADSWIMATEAGDATVVLCVLPLMHAAALSGLMWCVYQGAPLVLLRRFEPAAVLDSIERFGCTALACMPALWSFVVEEQARLPRCVSALRTAVSGGDTLPGPLQERFKAVFGLDLREVYGMTESVPIMSNPPGAVRLGSLGVPANGAQVRLADLNGLNVAEGEIGEILVRSSGNCAGYWNDPGATQAALRDGWLRTGDLALRDTDGYYWFKGRTKEIIIRAGSNISPQEVEEVLYRHPSVLEAGVVGESDPVYGEKVVAFVAIRPGHAIEEESLRQFARPLLAEYKVPEQVFFLDQLPKALTGKVQRRALREILAARTSPKRAIP
jgi:long-chain acyl-CoA synthetase